MTSRGALFHVPAERKKVSASWKVLMEQILCEPLRVVNKHLADPASVEELGCAARAFSKIPIPPARIRSK
jgi:hypothetical protein